MYLSAYVGSDTARLGFATRELRQRIERAVASAEEHSDDLIYLAATLRFPDMKFDLQRGQQDVSPGQHQALQRVGAAAQIWYTISNRLPAAERMALRARGIPVDRIQWVIRSRQHTFSGTRFGPNRGLTNVSDVRDFLGDLLHDLRIVEEALSLGQIRQVDTVYR